VQFFDDVSDADSDADSDAIQEALDDKTTYINAYLRVDKLLLCINYVVTERAASLLDLIGVTTILHSVFDQQYQWHRNNYIRTTGTGSI
jgi:hypothetical protein